MVERIFGAVLAFLGLYQLFSRSTRKQQEQHFRYTPISTGNVGAPVFEPPARRGSGGVTSPGPADEPDAWEGWTFTLFPEPETIAEPERAPTGVIPVSHVDPRDRFDALFEKHGKAQGVDPLLLKAIAIQESNLNPEAVSGAGAYGLMQILCRPDSEGRCTVKFNIGGWPPDHSRDLFNPDFNVYLGAQILRWNIDHARRNGKGLITALAIYNGGLGMLDRDPSAMPRETQGYIQRVPQIYASLGGPVLV